MNMGFEAMEIPTHIRHGVPDDLFGSGESVVMPPEQPLVLDLPGKPSFSPEHEPWLGNVSIIETESGFRLEVKGKLDDALHDEILKPFKGGDKKELLGQIEQHNARIEATLSPSERGILFAPLPRLCAGQQGELALVEPETFLFLNGDWSPLNFAIELPNFSLKQSDTTFEVDMEGQKVTFHVAEEKEVYNLDLVETEITENDLVRWLDRQLRNATLNQSILNRFLISTISHLIREKGYTLTALIRSKFLLVRALRQRLVLLQSKAASNGFQQTMFDNVVPLESSFRYSFEFKPGFYPARSPFYSGRYKFKKHYYPIIEDLKVEGEEFLCAQAIDASPKVKHWVRNLVDRQQASFRLPLAKGWFYPDFVAELEDSRLFVVEYKGAAYLTNDDSREKNAVGKMWADKSDGKCIFLMAVESDDKGRNVYQQLESSIEFDRTPSTHSLAARI